MALHLCREAGLEMGAGPPWAEPTQQAWASLSLNWYKPRATGEPGSTSLWHGPAHKAGTSLQQSRGIMGNGQTMDNPSLWDTGPGTHPNG